MDEVGMLFKNNVSIEEKYKKEIEKLKWNSYTDVLFSFRGIYVIGLSVYYKDYFYWAGGVIKPIINGMKNTRQRAYSRKFLKENYMNYSTLNELKELKDFINVYRTIGNLIPVWPGANVHRGQSQCYDLPNIYFNREEVSSFAKVYFDTFYKENDIYFIDVLSGKYSKMGISDLSKLSENDYKDFLVYITNIIKNRGYLFEKKYNVIF